MFGHWELLLILAIVIVVFGAKRIPDIMGGIGKGIGSFKRSFQFDGSSPEQAAARSSEPPKEKI